MKIKTALPALLTLVALSGCASFYGYNPNQLPPEELAILEVEGIDDWWLDEGELLTWIEGVYHEDGTTINDSMGINSSLQFQPGTYRIALRCTQPGYYTDLYNFHHINIDMEEGKKYIGYCLMKSELNDHGILKTIAMAGFISEEDAYTKERAMHQQILNELSIER